MIMSEILVIVIIAVLLWFAFSQGRWQQPKSKLADKQTLKAYEKRKSIFVNAAEQALFSALLRCRPSGYHIFTKVRLEDILGVKAAVKDQKRRWQYRGRIKSRHVDFLICDHRGNFMCAIELDGSAHNNAEAEMVDGFKDAIFASAGLALYRVKTGSDFDGFSQQLWAKINPN